MSGGVLPPLLCVEGAISEGMAHGLCTEGRSEERAPRSALPEARGTPDFGTLQLHFPSSQALSPHDLRTETHCCGWVSPGDYWRLEWVAPPGSWLKFMSQGTAPVFPFPSPGAGRRYVCGCIWLELWLASENG